MFRKLDHVSHGKYKQKLLTIKLLTIVSKLCHQNLFKFRRKVPIPAFNSWRKWCHDSRVDFGARSNLATFCRDSSIARSSRPNVPLVMTAPNLNRFSIMTARDKCVAADACCIGVIWLKCVIRQNEKQLKNRRNLNLCYKTKSPNRARNP